MEKVLWRCCGGVCRRVCRGGIVEVFVDVFVEEVFVEELFVGVCRRCL